LCEKIKGVRKVIRKGKRKRAKQGVKGWTQFRQAVRVVGQGSRR